MVLFMNSFFSPCLEIVFLLVFDGFMLKTKFSETNIFMEGNFYGRPV